MFRFKLAVLLIVLIPYGVVAKPDKADYKSVDKIVVIGDIHGDYEKLIEVLQSAAVIDSKLRWIAGKTHLVQLGDIPDRGPDTLKVIKFLQKLEKSASRKRGQVHILIGNHDAMNVYGDLRDVSPGEFKAFATSQSQKRLEEVYALEVAWINEHLEEDKRPVIDDAFRESWFSRKPLGYVEHRWNWLPGGEIGDWILTKNAVMKIGDNLFVHGGISPEFADWSIDSINNELRKSLTDVDNVYGTIARREDGPLWYRGLAMNLEQSESAHLEKLLAHFQVKRIIVGHTPTTGAIIPRFEGKVILADVGLSRHFGDNLACLVIEKDELYAVQRGTRINLPNPGKKNLIEYLKIASSLDPENQTIRNRIEVLQKPLEIDILKETSAVVE